MSKKAEKQLNKAPSYIAVKLAEWVRAVQRYGIEEIRKVKGFHDEPLTGKKQGRRSIRLSKSWRAEYITDKEHQGQILIDFVEIREVHHHDY